MLTWLVMKLGEEQKDLVQRLGPLLMGLPIS